MYQKKINVPKKKNYNSFSYMKRQYLKEVYK